MLFWQIFLYTTAEHEPFKFRMDWIGNIPGDSGGK